MAAEHPQNQSWFKRHKILTGIGGIFLFFFIVSALGSPKDGQEPSTGDTETAEVEQAVAVSASQLYSDYKQNELAADEKYKGKMIEVSGTVATIEEMFGQKFVTLNTGDILGKIQCFLDDSEGSKAASLTVGQQITLTGKGDGMSLNVAMKGCVIK